MRVFVAVVIVALAICVDAALPKDETFTLVPTEWKAHVDAVLSTVMSGKPVQGLTPGLFQSRTLRDVRLTQAARLRALVHSALLEGDGEYITINPHGTREMRNDVLDLIVHEFSSNGFDIAAVQSDTSFRVLRLKTVRAVHDKEERDDL